MRLKWIKEPESLHTYRAETVTHRFIMVAPPRSRPSLWVQPVDAEWGNDPIDTKLCRTKRGAERIAQRFANRPRARRLG